MLRQLLSNNSGPATQEEQYVSVTRTNRLMLPREIIAIYSEQFIKLIMSLKGAGA